MKKKMPPFKKFLADNHLTVEGFVREGEKRGVHLRVGTVFPWCRGVKPRITKQEELREAFP